MAYLIPDNLRSRKDASEPIRRVASAFASGLDDDVTVWFEPPFDPTGQRPHLVLLDPRVGVVVLEVLMVGERRRLLGGLRGKIRLDVNGEETEVDSPLLRASMLASDLRTQLASPDGLTGVQVGAAAVLPSTTRADAEQLGLSEVVDLDACIFQPDLDSALVEGNGSAVLRVLQRVCRGGANVEMPVTLIDQIRGVIHPEIVIEARSSQGSLFAASVTDRKDVIKVMDRKQEAFAKSLGTGHRVIRGVAGSGKTLVLVHRARLLARLLPSQRILLTCYTRSLASQLKAQVSDYPNIEVINLDRLMARVIKDAGMQHPGYSVGAPTVASVALKALETKPPPLFRAVLVDEAQDFDTDDLRFCREVLEARDPDSQDLVVVADSAQNIFRKNFRWKEAGIQAQGRTRMLRVNYRNTRQILEFAHSFLTADGSIPVDVDSDDGISVIPAESCERDGPTPTVTVGASLTSEVASVVDAVRVAAASLGRQSRSVAVLYGEDSGQRPLLINEALRTAGLDVFWVSDPNQRGNRDRAGSADETVLLSTIQAAKGLEFPHVVVCGLGVREDLTTARKLVYVGFTRAIDALTVIIGAHSPFLKDFESAAHVEVSSEG